MNQAQKKLNEALNLSVLFPEEQEEIIERVGVLIYQNVLGRTLEIMSDADQNEFEKLLDENQGPVEVISFLRNKIPDLETIIVEEANKLREKSEGIMGQIGN